MTTCKSKELHSVLLNCLGIWSGSQLNEISVISSLGLHHFHAGGRKYIMTHRINLFSDCIFPSCPWKLYLLTSSIFYCLCQKSSFETRVPYEKVLYGRCYITALETFKLSELPFKMNNRLHSITLFAYIHAEFTNVTECKPHWLSRF